MPFCETSFPSIGAKQSRGSCSTTPGIFASTHLNRRVLVDLPSKSKKAQAILFVHRPRRTVVGFPTLPANSSREGTIPRSSKALVSSRHCRPRCVGVKPFGQEGYLACSWQRLGKDLPAYHEKNCFSAQSITSCSGTSRCARCSGLCIRAE